MWLLALLFVQFFDAVQPSHSYAEPERHITKSPSIPIQASGSFDIPLEWSSLPIAEPPPSPEDPQMTTPIPRCGAGYRHHLPLLPDSEDYTHTSAGVSHGSAQLIEAIQVVAKEMRTNYPQIDPLFIGRLNQPGGSRNKYLMHQDGLDGDIGLYTLDGEQARFGREATPATLDKEHTWAEIKAFFDTERVQWILLDQSLINTLRRWVVETGKMSESSAERMFKPAGQHAYLDSKVVMHVPGHKNHMHVHMKCADPQD